MSAGAPSRSRTAPGGFSLPELAVVIGIGALVAAISFPEATRMLRKARLEEAAADIETALRISREKALARRTFYRITLDPVVREYVVEFEETPGVWTADLRTPAALPQGIGVGVAIDGADAGASPEDLLLEPRGTLSFADAPAVVTLFDDKGDSIRIEMVRTGRVRSWHL